MSVPDFYEAAFRWPHTDPNEVIVTGDFDAWSASKHLVPSVHGFEATFPVPWGRKIAYKYIVDGRWTTTDDQPTELDSMGNLNNVLSAPARPSIPKAPTLESPLAPAKTNGFVNGAAMAAKSAAVTMVEAIAPGTTGEPLSPVHQEVASHATESTEKVVDSEKSVNGTLDAPKEEEPSTVSDTAPVYEKEITAEAVLPKAAEITPAPVVPVPVLPLVHTDQPPAVESDVQGPLEVVVEGSTPAENIEPSAPTTVATVEPSTHTPVVPAETVSPVVGEAPDAAAIAAPPSEPAVEPSTHTPAPPVETKSNGIEAPEAPAPPVSTAEPEDEEVTDGAEALAPAPVPAEPAKTPVNGTNGTHESAPTLAPAPATNGKSSSTPSSPSKEKRHAFPSFGRTRRQSSIASVSSGTPDEHGNLAPGISPSRKSSQREKRRTSFFGRIKDIFSDDNSRSLKK